MSSSFLIVIANWLKVFRHTATHETHIRYVQHRMSCQKPIFTRDWIEYGHYYLSSRSTPLLFKDKVIFCNLLRHYVYVSFIQFSNLADVTFLRTIKVEDFRSNDKGKILLYMVLYYVVGTTFLSTILRI